LKNNRTAVQQLFFARTIARFVCFLPLLFRAANNRTAVWLLAENNRTAVGHMTSLQGWGRLQNHVISLPTCLRQLNCWDPQHPKFSNQIDASQYK